MLNIEHWKKEIIEIRKVGDAIAKKSGKPCTCNSIQCKECDFSADSCEKEAVEWLCKEYTKPKFDWDNDIDWRKVPTDTNVLVKNKDCEDWVPRRFAIYLPRVEYKYQVFCVFSGLQEMAVRENAGGLNGWRYCKLANAEDIEKYRKRG